MRIHVQTRLLRLLLMFSGIIYSAFMGSLIHSNRGANFESSLIAELLQLSGVEKSHTTPYHPIGNGQAERLNRTLGGMIRALPARSKVVEHIDILL